eukprot:1146590-Pelagomonas_calceolata.AAC.2
MQERIRDQKPSPQALGVGKVGCVMAKVRLIRKNDTLRIMDKFLTCKLVVGASGGTAIQECLRALQPLKTKNKVFSVPKRASAAMAPRPPAQAPKFLLGSVSLLKPVNPSQQLCSYQAMLDKKGMASGKGLQPKQLCKRIQRALQGD